MPTVPKGMLDPSQVASPPGLLGDDPSTRPDASSILQAASVMQGLGRIGRGRGETLGQPRRAKASKATGRTKAVLK